MDQGSVEKQLLKSIQLNTLSIHRLLQQEPSHYDWIRFDSNNACNLRCVYCGPTVPGKRGNNDKVDIQDAVRFFREHVISTNAFQLGCTQEPTFDERFDYFLMLGRMLLNPKIHYRVQTNGLLLDKYDPLLFRDAEVTHLTVSLDSLSRKTNAKQRSGADVNKILGNVASVMDAVPDMGLGFVCVVTKLNLHDVEDLVKFAISFGAMSVEIREVVLPYSGAYRNDKVRELRLDEGDFDNLKLSLASYENDIDLYFNSSSFLKKADADHLRNSRLLEVLEAEA